jgi:hypothetical protein
MIDGIVDFFWPRIRLILNFVGTVMIAFAFGKNIEDAHQEDKKGRPIYLASFLRPRLFKVGMFVLIAGFFISILSA